MNNYSNAVVWLPLIFWGLKGVQSCFAQGSLEPSGPVGPCMKSLVQLEPRQPISVPVVILQPGAYYLTTNVFVSSGAGIVILTNDVWLDLNGYTIQAMPSLVGGYGIRIGPDLRNIVIENGFIQGGVTNDGMGGYSGCGFLTGVKSDGLAQNVFVRNLSVSGCREDGISLGLHHSLIVEFSSVYTVGRFGITAGLVKECSATDCGGGGIYGLRVEDCSGVSVTNVGVNGSEIVNSFGVSKKGYGILAEMILNCFGQSSNAIGVVSSLVENSTGISEDAHGMHVRYCSSGCRGVSKFGLGLSTTVANTCVGTSTNWRGIYSVVAQNCFGFSVSSVGLYSDTVSFSVGSCSNGCAIQATVGNSCLAMSGSNSIVYKYNMP